MTRLAIGIGCRKGCAANAIVEVVERAVAEMQASAGNILPPQRGGGVDALSSNGTGATLFTAEAKRGEPGLSQAAQRLGLPLVILHDAELAAAAPRCVTRSARVEAMLGLPSLAEAAALAGAGPNSRLVVARISDGGATCAIATSPETPQ